MDQVVGKQDSVLLEILSEDSFVSNLQLRYLKNSIYTYIGTFLVSVNPYFKLHTSTDLVRTYAQQKSLFQLPPHIYSLTNSAYQSLQDSNEDQVIITFGESASGKTENSRMIVNFLTQISDKRKPMTLLKRQKSSNSISSFKGSSNSCSSTPKHKLITSATGTLEKTGCIKSGIRKLSREKTVEFDFSYQKSSELSIAPIKCAKHNDIQVKHCAKHNCCNQTATVTVTTPTSSTSTTTPSIPIDVPQRSKDDGFMFQNDLPTTSKSFSIYETMNRVHHRTVPNDIQADHKQNRCKCENTEQIHSTSINTTNANILKCKLKMPNTSSSMEDSINLTKNIRFKSVANATPSHSHDKHNIDLDIFKSAKRVVVPNANGIGGGIYLYNQPTHIELQFMKDRIAIAEVFLEAMGNAMTPRNNNSSRFGKYFDVEINFRGDPIGGHLTHYMLEKTRVTKRMNQERNFHIFYQLLAGADIHFLKSLKLQRNVNKYELLKETDSNEDDKINFAYAKKSLEVLGLSQDEMLSIFKIIAVVLKLGNLVFIPTCQIDGTEGCEISNDYEIHEIAQLLHLDEEVLINCLTKTGSNWMENGSELDALNANLMTKALCRTLYGRLFTFIVNRINESMKIKHFPSRGKNLGILDFFGFESLDHNCNSFEQLSINYCNEKLHQSFTENVLKFQQELYAKEGLEWTKVDYYDNQTICELLDKPSYGILCLMDESKVTTDEILLNRFHQCCSGHTSFSTQDHVPPKCFQIRHFSGTLNYSINGFADKNLDKIPKHLSAGLYQHSKLSIVQNLFPEGNPKRASKKPIASISSILRTSLQTLLSKVERRKCYYVFCIRPNDHKLPKSFELALVQHQVRYMSLMPLVNLWRNGYYFNLSHTQFLNRYKLLSPYTWPHYNTNSAVESIAQIIRSVPLPAAEFAIGSSRIFIRSPRTVYELNEFRNLRLNFLATLIQKSYRCFSQRKHFQRMRKCQILIAKTWCTFRDCRYGIPFSSRKHHWELYGAAREEFRVEKYRNKIEWAVGIIQRHYVLWKRRQYLMTLPLRFNTNSMSPVNIEWPSAPRFLMETSQLLKNIFHRWRCYKYRKSFDQTSRNRMREKVTASIIFKDRKASYIKSVSHPFLGDYVRLRQNVQWKKICVENNDQYVVFADIINKITRSSGKFVPILLVLSTSSMLLLDQRTLQIKYRVPATEIYRMSLSPYLDDIAVFHIKAESMSSTQSNASDTPTGCLFQSDFGRKKGDFVFQTGHVIEIVTKLFLVVQNATTKPPEIHISTEFEANFGQQTVVFTFKCGGLSEMSQQQLTKVSRKGNRMEVIV